MPEWPEPISCTDVPKATSAGANYIKTVDKLKQVKLAQPARLRNTDRMIRSIRGKHFSVGRELVGLGCLFQRQRTRFVTCYGSMLRGTRLEANKLFLVSES